MKNLILLPVILLYLPYAMAQDKSKPAAGKTFTVSGTITQSSDYCGGDELSPEDMEKAARPYPAEGKKIFIRKGSKNTGKAIFMEFTVDAKGNFSIQLPPGKYCVIDAARAEKLDLSLYKNEDLDITSEECMKKWWSTCQHVIEVKDSDVKDVKINFHVHCFTNSTCPCIIYTGPPPP